jgi:hypothetical protein
MAELFDQAKKTEVTVIIFLPSEGSKGVEEATGIVKEKIDPLPGSDSTVIVPPWSSTRYLEILNPNPVPPYSLAIDPSPCSNSLKIRACFLFLFRSPYLQH